MAAVRLLMMRYSARILGGRSIFTKAISSAPIQIQMPALSPTMVEGTITKWLIAEGESVEVGDALCEVETDKAVVTMEATEEGTLAKILVPEGTSNIKISVPIAILAEEGEDVKQAAAMPVSFHDAQKQPDASPAVPQPATVSKTEAKKSLLSPAVRQAGQQYGIDLTQITGTGPKGMILKGDVLAYVKANNLQPKLFEATSSVPPTSSAPPPAAPSKPLPVSSTSLPVQNAATHTSTSTSYTDLDLSNVRKVIAKRLTESKQQIPHAYASIQCTISRLVRLRKDLAKEGTKLSVNDFIIKAVARTLRQVPEANSVWLDGVAEQSPSVDVSVAVATDGGLITPIIKNASGKGVSEIGREVRELAGRAREGKLKPDEFQGGSFTISNLGMFGIREFTAVINPPQTCIMAVGGTRAVPSHDVIDLDSDVGDDVAKPNRTVESVMTVTLSSDARVVDDVVASKFLEQFKRNIENPIAGLL